MPLTNIVPMMYEERNKLRVQRKRLRDKMDPFDIPTKRFREIYRMVPELAIEFIEELRPFYDDNVQKIPLHLQLLSTLNFYASGSYAFAYLNQSMVSKCIIEISDSIVKNLNRKYVNFPHSLNEMEPIMQRFMEKTSFPGIVGLIDGTHIAIAVSGLPKGTSSAFVNRKHFHSINTQIICDYDMRILNVNARFCGSTSDAHIWANSFVYVLLETIHTEAPKSWLLGDSGYPLQPWILTPLRSQRGTLTDNEKLYNKHHCKVRSIVERCIGLLKARFRCLLGERKLKYSHHVVAQIIYACCILHNFLIDKQYMITDIEPRAELIVNRDLRERRRTTNLAALGRQQINYVINVLTGMD